MESVINVLNQAGATFVGFSWAMLFQSSVLIVVLYGVDLLIRRRVRAVVRYGVWMLVLVKLILPPTLSAPTGIGYWVSVPAPAQEIRTVESQPVLPVAAKVNSTVNTSSLNAETTPQSFIETSTVTKVQPEIAVPIEAEKVRTLTWHAWMLCAWIAGVIAVLGLLFQRLWFVRRLLAQSRPADAAWDELTQACAEQVGLRNPIEMRVSKYLHSPAACGLIRPVILMPKAIEHAMSQDRRRAILLHELVHIKRADLWVNLIQTLLQVAYFYNPLPWLANAHIRNLREKAVDETVLTKLGHDDAGQYSTTLIDIAEIAFTKPHFSLGLIGVVESRKALTGRIKHILGRPMPTSAKIGIAGLVCIMVFAFMLLPMTRGPWTAPLYDEETRSLLDQLPADEKDPSRFSFPDHEISDPNRTIPPAIDRQYDQVRQYIDELKGELTKGQYTSSRQEFEALRQTDDAFPVSLYAQRWLIILDWLYGKCDTASAAEQMMRLAEAQTDMPQANFTRAYAAVILARDGHLDMAHDMFMDCPPTQTPQWGWFVFEMNKYMDHYVAGCAPNVDRMIRGSVTQKARTDAQWQSLEKDLRAAQTAYADYIEYDLLPSVAAVVNHHQRHPFTDIERLQCVDSVVTLMTQHLSCFSLGHTTKAIAGRVRLEIHPKILAAWSRLLDLHDPEQQPDKMSWHVDQIKSLCAKLDLPLDVLPRWWDRISADADKAPSGVRLTWVEAGRMPHVARVHLVMRKVSKQELREINRLIEQLKSEDEAEWQTAAKALSAIGPKVAGPLSGLFDQGGLDVKAVNILKPMAQTEQVQAVMVSILEFNRALYNNAPFT
ncbi:MAG: M56 family metallopeptidase [Phycisphaerae bacterium]|nr:M56 family metallopeptidase [Phycisphaerae bacterium]